MPGHSQAATATYPELSCTGGPFNYFEDQGSQRLEIYMEGPGMPKQLLPPRLLFRK